jgi:hypothetical protein
MRENSAEITVYHYTAWDGYSWQGCDEKTAASLQSYIDATGTMPEASYEEPPFGGAISCQIAGETGVGVYRYLRPGHGHVDMSDRGCLYLSFAFIPLGASRVDFEKLLGHKSMSVAQLGALGVEKLPVDAFRIDSADAEGGEWRVKSESWTFSGRDGLKRLSALFFEEATQLGILKARFEADGDDMGCLKATVSYSVFREVTEVVTAAQAVEDGRRRAQDAGKTISPDDEVYARLKEALEDLDARANKLDAYTGLKAYIRAMKRNLDSEELQLRRRQMDEHSGEMDGILSGIQSMSVECRKWPSAFDKCLEVADSDTFDLPQYADRAKNILSLQAMADPSFKNAVERSMSVAEKSASALCSVRVVKALLGGSEPGDAEAVLKSLRILSKLPAFAVFNGLDDWAGRELDKLGRAKDKEHPSATHDTAGFSLGNAHGEVLQTPSEGDVRRRRAGYGCLVACLLAFFASVAAAVFCIRGCRPSQPAAPAAEERHDDSSDATESSIAVGRTVALSNEAPLTVSRDTTPVDVAPETGTTCQDEELPGNAQSNAVPSEASSEEVPAVDEKDHAVDEKIRSGEEKSRAVEAEPKNEKVIDAKGAASVAKETTVNVETNGQPAVEATAIENKKEASVGKPEPDSVAEKGKTSVGRQKKGKAATKDGRK